MKTKSHATLYAMIGVIAIVVLFFARKQVKSGICGLHNFSFCQATPALFEGDPSTGIQNFQSGLSGKGGGGGVKKGGGCSHTDITFGRCNPAKRV